MIISNTNIIKLILKGSIQLYFSVLFLLFTEKRMLISDIFIIEFFKLKKYSLSLSFSLSLSLLKFLYFSVFQIKSVFKEKVSYFLMFY